MSGYTIAGLIALIVVIAVAAMMGGWINSLVH